MQHCDFFKILESFPGKEELRNSMVDEILKKYNYLDFGRLRRCLKNCRLFLNPKNEEQWFKFLALLVIMAENQEEGNDISESYLQEECQKTAEAIVEKFNRKFFDSKLTILDISGISLEELIEFAKSGDALI